MLTFVSTNFDCDSKDARSNAPSNTCAHNNAFSSDMVIIAGIAVAMSVFLYVVMAIITSGIIMNILNVIIYVIMIICVNYIIMKKIKKLNMCAKP